MKTIKNNSKRATGESLFDSFNRLNNLFEYYKNASYESET